MRIRCRLLFGPKKWCKVSRNNFLHILLAGESQKNVGENGAELEVGGINALSTVQCYPILC